MKNLINKIPKSITSNWYNILLVILMLLWVVGMSFRMPQIFVAGVFCAIFVPAVQTSSGKKYAIPLAVVGFAWFVVSLIMFFM